MSDELGRQKHVFAEGVYRAAEWRVYPQSDPRGHQSIYSLRGSIVEFGEGRALTNRNSTHLFHHRGFKEFPFTFISKEQM